MGCDDSGLNSDVCTVPDIPAGQTRVVTFRTRRPSTASTATTSSSSSTGLDASDDADYDVRVSWPPGSTDWRVVVTPAVGMGGLQARHEVVVTNLGRTATNAVLNEQLQAGEQLVSTSLGSGARPGRERAALRARNARGPRIHDARRGHEAAGEPRGTFHVVDVGSDTPDVNDSHLFGSAPAVSAGATGSAPSARRRLSPTAT